MFSVFKVSLRRVVSILLITIVLFFGVGTSIDLQNAIAASSTRDVTNANMEDSVSNTEYESAKARRQRKQALRSMAAKTKGKRAKQNETAGEKLNLDEDIPKSTQTFFDRITDEAETLN